MICANASNRALVKEFGALTTEKIIERNYPAIGALQLEHKPERVHDAIAIIVAEASTYFEEPMHQEKALDIAVEITAQYYWLTLEDVMLTLRDLKHQKLYGKLTPNKVLAAIADHANRRADIAGQMSLNKHLATKHPRGPEPDMRKQYHDDMDKYRTQQAIQKQKSTKP